MKTDRRTFLKALSASFAATAAAPAIRPAASDVFESSFLGLRLTKPERWRYVDTALWNLIWANTRFDADDYSDEELKEVLGQPLVVIAPVRLDSTNVHVNVSLWPEPPLPDGIDLVLAHRDHLDLAASFMRDFELLAEPRPSSLGRLHGSGAQLRYSAELQDGFTAPCVVEHFLVVRPEALVGINLARAESGHASSVIEELESVRDSFEPMGGTL